MIFSHENDLRLQEFDYLCKREVKWTLSCSGKRLCRLRRLLRDWKYT